MFKMVKEGMLVEFDYSKLFVIVELNFDWLDKFYDKGNKYLLF